MYIHVPFGHAVFIKKHIGTSSVISDQALMHMCSLGNVFYSRFSSVKQLTFEIYIILSKFYLGLKFQTVISSHQDMEMSLTNVWVMDNMPR